MTSIIQAYVILSAVTLVAFVVLPSARTKLVISLLLGLSGFAFLLVVADGAPPEAALAVIPFVALIILLSARRARACSASGSAQPRLPYGRGPTFCPDCGARLPL